jgi:hypothetical protein
MSFIAIEKKKLLKIWYDLYLNLQYLEEKYPASLYKSSFPSL